MSTAATSLQKWAAEFFGTFILVFFVIGAALFSAGFASGSNGLNVGFLGVAIALGVSVIASAYAFGGISGGHFNPAVSLGLALAGRFAWRELAGYWIAQLLGAVAASSVLALVAPSSSVFAGASTGYDALSPGHFSLGAAFLTETVATMVFVLLIVNLTGSRGAGAFAPLAIGLTLTGLALVAIPVSNASFNPARSVATAIYAGPDALGQLWLSIIAPLSGAVIAAILNRVLEPKA